MLLNGYSRVPLSEKVIEMEEEKGTSIDIDIYPHGHTNGDTNGITDKDINTFAYTDDLGDLDGGIAIRAPRNGMAYSKPSNDNKNASFTAEDDAPQNKSQPHRSSMTAESLPSMVKAVPPHASTSQMRAPHGGRHSITTQNPLESSDFSLWDITHKKHASSSSSKLWHGRVFRRLFVELMNRGERRLLYFVLFSTFCCGALRLIFFIFIAGIIDLLADTYYSDLHHICNLHEYIHCESNNQLIHVFAVTLIIVSIFAAIFGFARSTLTSVAVCSFLTRLNETVFDKLMDQNLSYFESRRKNDLRILLTTDMKSIRLSLHRIVIVIEASIHFLCGICYLFIINWDIALIIVGSFILLSMISIIFIRKSEAVHRLRRQAFKLVTTGVLETLSYITTIKTFSKEDDESYIYSQCIKSAFNAGKEANSLLYAYRFWMSIIIYFTILSIIWYVAFLMLDFDNEMITLGVLVIDLFIFMQLNWSIYQIVIFCPAVLVKGGQSLMRILQVYDLSKYNKRADPRVHRQKSFMPPTCVIDGRVEIRNLNFSYPKRRRKRVLNGINMDFHPATTTAVVGQSGSGKSTILKLIMRFFEAKSGQILIDGIDYKQYNIAFLHSQIAYVGHDVALFENRSIADNIKFGMKLDKKHHFLFDAEYFDEERMFFWRKLKSINQTQVERVAKIANAHGFIMNLENGYDTKYGGEHGIRLSHGERQRIGIARALLLDPRILLLDEAMVGVDAVSKRLIQQSLDRIMIGRCVVVIAHRLKTVQNADRIYVIKKGKNVAHGTHQELVESNNQHYLELTHKQCFD
eukprot:1124353_1